MYINFLYYKKLSKKDIAHREVRDRFKIYYNDLAECYRVKNNMKKGVLRYVTFENLLDFFANQKQVSRAVQDSDLIIRPVWQSYIDPDHSSESLYMKHVLRVDAHIIDVGNVGNICSQVALSYSSPLIISKDYKHISLLTFESSVKQIFNKDGMNYSEINFVSMISISPEPKKHGIEIIKVCFDNSLIMLINSIEKEVNNTNVVVLYRESKLINECVLKNTKKFYRYHMLKVNYPISSGFLTNCLNKIMLKTSNEKKMYFIVDIDLETNRLAGVLVNA